MNDSHAAGSAEPASGARDAGRALRRRLIPAAIALPILAGALRWEGQHVGLYSTDVGIALMVGFMVVIGSALVLLVTRHVSRSEHTRMRAEEALQDARFLLDTLMENSPDHIYFKDVESRFVRVSPSTARHLGLDDPADAVGKTDADFFSEEHAQKALAAERRLLAEGTPIVYEVERETWHGRPDTWVETMKVPMRDAQGRIIGLVGISRDITGRRRAEEQLALLEAQKVESLSALAGGVAHDFNNLLVGVLGNASLALSELPDDSPVRSTIEEILVAGERMAKLAREMLVYSGRGRFVLHPLGLSTAVEEVAKLLGGVIPPRVRLQLRTRDEKLPRIDADEAQIRQVIASLITNAVEAVGEDEGIVTVRTGLVDATREYLREMKGSDDLPEREYVYLEVSDSGRGISPAAASRIFEPFFSTKFTGRGLGLAAVLGIVRGHRGGVKVESDVGRGTTFTLIFPPAPSRRTASSTPTPAPSAGQAGYILVADDDKIVRSVTAQMLERAGFRVLLATDGEEALELFRARPSEILAVVLDLVMPGRGGEEVLAQIRAERGDVPVLLCSGYGEIEAASASESEFVRFIPKPYTNELLLSKLRELLARAAEGRS